MSAWLETIELQSFTQQKDELNQVLYQLVKKVKMATVQQHIDIYHRYRIESDYMIQIYHTDKLEANGSSLGIRIASALKEFGMVNHTIWQSQTDKQADPAN